MKDSIYHTDYLEGLNTLDMDSIDLVFTDPPYQFSSNNDKGGGFYRHEKKQYITNIDKSFGLSFNPRTFLNDIVRLMDKFNLYVWTNRHLLKDYLEFAISNNFHYDILIWNKSNPVPINFNHYLFDKEYLVYIRETGGYFNNNLPHNTYRTIREHSIGNNKTTHPTEKPLKLLYDIIKISTKEGDTVLDPFCGSGSIPLACKQLKRHYIGFDNNLEYVKMAKSRLNQSFMFNY